MKYLLRLIGRSDLLRMKRKKKLIWKLKSLLRIDDFSFITDFYGFKYSGHTQNQIDKYVYYFGAYERGILHFIESTLKRSHEKIFVDIGANIGHHSLYSSKYAAQVYAFEPYEKVRNELIKKISDNHITNIKVFPFALGEENQEMVFFEPSDHNTGTGSFIENFSTENKKTGLKLQVKNGSEVFKKENLRNVSLIKIDTEGFEPEVLSGLLVHLKDNKPVLIIEFSAQTRESINAKKELIGFLKNNYTSYIFENVHEWKYHLKAWNFDKTGNVVFIPKD